MTQFKIIIHCDQFNAVLLEDHESRDAALDKYLKLIDERCILKFGEVLVNTARITFIQAVEIVEEPLKEHDIIEV